MRKKILETKADKSNEKQETVLIPVTEDIQIEKKLPFNNQPSYLIKLKMLKFRK